MRLDPTPLRTAALAAGVFLLVRIVYRGIFGGLGGSLVLVELPRVRLGGPLALLTLFGPIALDGIGAAVLGAMPFAALILAFGAVAAVVDLRRLIARWADRGPARSLARAVLIALATLPSLASAVRGARRAAGLRGERVSAALLVPVVEHTLERALALAASLELRGFGAVRRHEGRCESPVVFRDVALGYAHGGDGTALLDAVELTLGTGALVLVSGPTGSGKSTLLRAMNGLFQHFDGGLQRGRVEIGGLDRRAVPPRECAGFVGAVGQSARTGFAARTVSEELGLALTLRRVPAELVAARVAETAAAVDVAALLDRPLAELSAGEAARVAIGAAVIGRPVLLTVDEPLAELDADARARTIELLDRLAHEAGVCVVVAEHRVDGFAGRVDVGLVIEAGRVRVHRPADRMLAAPDAGVRASAAAPASAVIASAASAPGPRDAERIAAAPDRAAPRPRATAGPGRSRTAGRRTASAPVGADRPTSAGLLVRGLVAAHGERVVLEGVDLTLASGEVLAITGPNGVGKSSLLGAIALPTAAGTVRVGGLDVHGRSARRRRELVALVPEDVDALFTTTTVADECRRTDRRHRAPGQGAFERFTAFLDADPARAAALAGRHPRDLSAGERLCLAIAIQSQGAPAVLLVDEPVRGLDADSRRLVADAIRTLAADGSAVCFATHEAGFAAGLAQRTIRLQGGRLGVAAAAGGVR